jgi:uncharacterized FAD-dependent dehydrogenase
MQKILQLKMLPSEAENASIIKQYAANAVGLGVSEITGFTITKRSIDSRAKQIWIILTLQLFINEPFEERKLLVANFQDVIKVKKTVIIIGAGPAGLFAALKLIELGIKPIILERGKDVRARRRDLAKLNKEGIINEESNYCFGEGGAGTYSDGKLYTRSSKRGNVDRILNLFVQFGAEKNILFDAHPHIGTNKLPHIIIAMRQLIVDCGGVFLFEKKVVDFVIENEKIQSVKSADGNSFIADAIILATGHSARDIFYLLNDKRILIEAKPFALGVRIEHPQKLIDSIQYHCTTRNEYLSPASYSLVEQINNRGVFSFCMCPGGIIAPASTNNYELVVNGWSPSKRNNPFANSGMVVSVDEKDAVNYFKKSNRDNTKENALLLMNFQHVIEQKAFDIGGGKFVAPAQRMTDFASNKISSSLPDCSYLPGIKSSSLKEVLPDFIHECLQKAFVAFGKKMKGYFTDEAVVVATESRTSSPVRIPRDNHLLHHPQIQNLYPCGEGAGYAGGIMSAAMDGEKVAEQIARILI